MPSYKFLTERALFIPKEKALVIADLHLGIEYGLRKSGITIPSQTENLRARLEKLIRQTAAKKLIILGDIKDEFRGLSWQEMREAPNFFSELAKKVELHLVKGNHDGLTKEKIKRKFCVWGTLHPAIDFLSSCFLKKYLQLIHLVFPLPNATQL